MYVCTRTRHRLIKWVHSNSTLVVFIQAARLSFRPLTTTSRKLNQDGCEMNRLAKTVLQGSNLTFELNSQMASTCSGFTSHKLVSTSLGTSVQHKIKKMSKILLLSNFNKICNITKNLNAFCLVCLVTIQ